MGYFSERAIQLQVHAVTDLGFNFDEVNPNLAVLRNGNSRVEISYFDPGPDSLFSTPSLTIYFYGDASSGFDDSEKLYEFSQKLNNYDFDEVWLTNYFHWDMQYNQKTGKSELLLAYRISKLKDELFTQGGLMVLPLFFSSSFATAALVAEKAHQSKLRVTKELRIISNILPIPNELKSS